MCHLAIMQPYFVPYVAYFQLIAAVDLFIVYDNIKYTKKGWINRNRILVDGADTLVSLPLKAGSDSLQVRERELAASFDPKKLLRQIVGAYQAAPYFKETLPLLERILLFEDRNLFRFLRHSITEICLQLGIETRITSSSEFDIDHGLKGQDKVLALCHAAAATTYVNAIGGIKLYSVPAFAAHDINLKFIASTPPEYPQFGKTFVPGLSIIDVLMFNSRQTCQEVVRNNFRLVGKESVTGDTTKQ